MAGYDKYIRGKVLGKGSFGSAVLVESKVDGKKYVIKEIDISRMPKAERESAEQEAKLLMALNHPNIVRCTECFTHQSKLCIVMDWCSEGDLYSICQKRRGAPLPEDTLQDWLVQISLGLKHVHDRKILHRDIKSQNIFCSAGGLLKLGDFGVSKVLSSTWQLAATAVGTPYYLSPEICQNRKYNQKSDIWSLGCVMYELSVGRHAFEAPNMRALIQKIIKGQYTPIPATRSKELRDLIDRMLTVNWEKRPSVNDILAAPLMKARISKFLSATLHASPHQQDPYITLALNLEPSLQSNTNRGPLQSGVFAHEFSHTIIHGKPERGQLVVQPKGSSGAGLAPAAAAPPPAAAGPAAAGPPRPAQASARPAAAPAGPAAGPAGARGPSPSALQAAAKVNGRPAPGGLQAVQQQRAVAAGNAAAVPNPMAMAAAAAQRAQEAAAAAKMKMVAAAKEREDAAAAVAASVAAARKRADEEGQVRKQRELNAMAAQREVERLRLEEQRKKVEGERLRLEADRKRAEAGRQEAERAAKVQEEAGRKAAAEEQRQRVAAEAKRRQAGEEAQRREAERAGREAEREELRAKMAAQRQEFQERQQAAQRNRGQALQGDGPAAPAPAPPGRPRRQWSPVHVPDERAEQAAEAKLNGRAGREEGGLTPEQRRAVWEDMRAGAERNRRAAAEGEQQRGRGLAAFLGVPDEPEQPTGRQATPPAAERRRPGSGAQEERARVQREPPPSSAAVAAAAAPRQDRSKQTGNGSSPASQSPAQRHRSPARPSEQDAYDRRRKRLESEAVQREAQILEFQRQHWQEMKVAAARNRAQLLRDVQGSPGGASGGQEPDAASQPTAQGKPEPPVTAAAQAVTDAEDLEFAAMVKEMQDILIDGGEAAEAGSPDGELSEDDDQTAAVRAPTFALLPLRASRTALAGRFMLNGVEVPLEGVRSNDSLAHKVEALRMFLDQKLGTQAFLKVYRRLESLSLEDDESEVSREFLAVLGQDKLPYLQLIHQLIVCEENLNCA
ncbi:hypothetical protein QJQ45_020808 [Haematococcus lacustris]|nr:hypothetical protein QJQ45_020808 [Haematococcus lacustris]